MRSAPGTIDLMSARRRYLPDMNPLSAAGIVLFLVAQSGFWIAWRFQNPFVSVENGPMEIFQALTILAGLVILVGNMALTKPTPNRVLLGAMALFYATFVLGEIDMREAGSPLLELIFDGAIRDILLTALWVLAAMIFWRHRQTTWRLFLDWLPTPGGLLLLVAGGFWILSGTIDKLHWFPGTHHFFEELAETNATVLMLLGAIHVSRFLRSKQRSLSPGSTFP